MPAQARAYDSPVSHKTNFLFGLECKNLSANKNLEPTLKFETLSQGREKDLELDEANFSVTSRR